MWRRSMSMRVFNLSFVLFFFSLILHLMISHMLFKRKLLLFFLNLTCLQFSIKLSFFLLLRLLVALHVLLEFFRLFCAIIFGSIIVVVRRLRMSNWNDWNDLLFCGLMMIDRDDWDFSLMNWSRLTVMFDQLFMVIIVATWILSFILIVLMYGIMPSRLFLIHVSQFSAFSPMCVHWGNW